MPSATHRDDTFVNAKGEAFHVSTFPPRGTPGASSSDAPPVLLCVHGAGMSGDNFYRLAMHLQREGRDAAAATSGGGVDGTAAEQPASHPHNAASGGGAMMPPQGLPRPHGFPNPAHTALGPATGDCAVMHQEHADAHDSEIAIAVVTFDLRCHGDSTYAGGEDHLTLEVMAHDFCEVLEYAKTTLYPSSAFYVLGHSLGGSIVARGLSSPEAQERVAGVVLVDVVEGTAKASLKHMHDFLERRPVSFPSVKDAETWFLRHGGMRTPEGAAISVPPLLKQDAASGQYVWRTDLRKMEVVWDGWFDGLDKAFLALPFPKMLCLANAERLDTTLTVAQMQGKFQFEIIGNNCGHYVMDDATAVLGTKIARFVKRIETLTKKLKTGIRPGMALHLNNATVPASRQDK